jgi:phosphoglycerol transferase
MLNEEKNTRWKEALLYIVALLLTAWAMERLLKLRQSHLWSMPWGYSGDAFIYSYIIKATITNGWFWTNDALSMPGVLLFRDYPYPDNIQFLFIRVIGWFTGNYARTLNVFYLLTYPLTTICTLYVLRRFGVSYAPAVMISLLYNFSYYHIHRGIHHMMYGTYYMVPLMVMVMLWALSGELRLRAQDGSGETSKSHKRKWIIAVLICLFVGSTGCAYYPFFAVALFVITGLVMVFRQRSVRALALPGVLAGLVFSSLLLNVTPTLLFRYQYGSVGLGKRVAAESEIYGMKVTQLLIPINEHRLKGLNKFREKYNRESPLNTENGAASLGFIGSAGFLFLIGFLFLYRRSQVFGGSTGADESRSLPSLLDNLSILNGWAVLVATIGGFGTLFAYLISPQIRSYNRISAYIAFFSFFTVALILDVLSKKYFHTRLKRGLFYALLVFLTFFGLLDQTPKVPAINYEWTLQAYRHDQEYFRQIESVMPDKAMIFQLPVYSFPEDINYDHMRGYLQSDKLRWSAGAMKDRQIYIWQKAVEKKSVPEMLEELAVLDFSGLYIDRAGPTPIPPGFEDQISAALSLQKPLVSKDGRMAFYSLLEYKKKVRDGVGKDELGERAQRYLNPFTPVWKKDFSAMEGTQEKNWRWSGPNGELHIENVLDIPREVMMEMSIDSPNGGTLRIGSDFISDTLKIATEPAQWSRTVVVPPGKHVIKFTCDAPPAYYPPDPRVFVFRITNFKLSEKYLDKTNSNSSELKSFYDGRGGGHISQMTSLSASNVTEHFR